MGEETGLEVRITEPLDSIEYWFVQRGTRIHKTVHYFLMEPIGGDLDRHDHEFDQVKWLVPAGRAGRPDVRDGAGPRRPRSRPPPSGSPGRSRALARASHGRDRRLTA